MIYNLCVRSRACKCGLACDKMDIHTQMAIIISFDCGFSRRCCYLCSLDGVWCLQANCENQQQKHRPGEIEN